LTKLPFFAIIIIEKKRRVIVMMNFAVIIGNPCGCHTVEHYSDKETALKRAAAWQNAGSLACVFEVYVNLKTLEVSYTPLN
jgi:hypothetical protein